MHAGSTVALSPKQVDMGDDGIYSANAGQRWLLGKWGEFIASVKAQTKGRRLVLVLGGDLVDGARHHGTFQSWGTPQAQVAAAVELLLPLANIASKIYGLRGTPCHAGESGADDAAVIKELGGKAAYRWQLEIDDTLFDVAHHGRRDGRVWTEGNAGLAEIRKARLAGRSPHYIIRHHVHKHDLIAHSGITFAACPSWQLQTEHGRRIDPANIDDIGGLIWTKSDGLRPLLYHPKPDPVTKVN